MTPRQLAGAIEAANRAALDSCGSPLVNVIINSHGSFGDIYIGGLKKPNGEFERTGGDIHPAGSVWLRAGR
jgi:hypothetical protein